VTGVPVLVAVTGAPWESEFVAALGTGTGGLTVVRRCVDLADLLATGATAAARAALVWPDLHRLDKDALRRLADCGVAVVGVVASGAAQDEQTALSLGISPVIAADAGPEHIHAVVSGAANAKITGDAGTHEVQPARPGGAGPAAPSGRLIAVWGPTGAPGRSTVAVGIASEMARLGVETVLADADVYGGTVAPALGLLDEAPGLVVAARLANSGRLDLGQLAAAARTVEPRMRVLTGIGRSGRWPELRVAAIEEVWDRCRELAAATVVDTAFCIEQDEEIVFDTAAPRRNGATLVTLECADVVVVVGSADPIGVIRLIQALDDLRAAVPSATVRVVVNQVRKTSVGARPGRQLRDLLDRHGGIQPHASLPFDRSACDAALAVGRTLGEVAPSAPLRTALRDLATELADVRTRGRARRRFRAKLSR
jgi:Flp pilus assembly CpaE family ATPase